MRSLYEAPLHSPFSISILHLDIMSKSWNELLTECETVLCSKQFDKLFHHVSYGV